MEEEEWSYVPVGGPLPKARQTVTAFGAAANLVGIASWPHIQDCRHCNVYHILLGSQH